MSNIVKCAIVSFLASVVITIAAIYSYNVVEIEPHNYYLWYQNSKIQKAYYSEITTGIDYEGRPYTEVDYWEEPLSDFWYVELINSRIVLQDSGGTLDLKNEFPVVFIPQILIDFPKRNLDRVGVENKTKFRLFAQIDGKYDFTNVSAQEYRKLLSCRSEKENIQIRSILGVWSIL